MTAPSPTLPARDPAPIIILAGVCAALHASKLPPAIAALQEALGISLVQAGFLLSLVQVAGMTCGIAVGLAADRLGARRSIALGLVVLALASLAGGTMRSIGGLMALRAAEGFGFLLVVLPTPGLLRSVVAPQRIARTIGWWGAYMPLGTTLALLLGPGCIESLGWRGWWWLLGAVTLVMAAVFARAVPAAAPAPTAAPASAWRSRLRQTLSARGPWLVAGAFAAYSGQWLAVIGFLPVIAAQAGATAAAIGALTALAAAANIAGNVMAGRLLQRGVTPARLMSTGFVAMTLGAAIAFAGAPVAPAPGGAIAAEAWVGVGTPAALRYAALLVFSMLGGLIPATLFSIVVRVAPSEHSVATTVGWMQQWSAFGQFAGPPLVAWVASRIGGWQFTWLVTGACSLLGLLLVRAIGRLGALAGPSGAPARPDTGA